MKQVAFHDDFASVTVCVNGAPIALHAEVDIILKRPAKLADKDKQAWEMLKGAAELAVQTVSYIPKGE